jgi:hypothetical protein
LFLVTIRFHDWERSEIGRIRNFGEDIWRALREQKAVQIDLDEIDQSVHEVRFSCRRTYLRQALEVTFTIMREHMVDNEADVLVSE